MGSRTESRAFKIKFGVFVVLLLVFVNLPLFQSLTEGDPNRRMGTTGVLVTLAIDAALLLLVLAIARPGRRAVSEADRFEAYGDVEPVEPTDDDWDAATRGAAIEGADSVTLLGEVLETTDDEVLIAAAGRRVVVVLDQFVNLVPEGHAARVRGRWL